ncbi:MAG: DUF4845 domain-containing protein [Arenicella sp.]
MNESIKFKPSTINMHRQQGWSFWSLSISLMVVVFFCYIGMLLVPVYSTNKNIENAMSIAFDRAGQVRTLSRKKYLDLLARQLYLDGSYEINPKDLVYKKDKRGVSAQLKYDRVVPVVMNISLKVDFDIKAEKKF